MEPCPVRLHRPDHGPDKHAERQDDEECASGSHRDPFWMDNARPGGLVDGPVATTTVYRLVFDGFPLFPPGGGVLFTGGTT